VVLAAIGLGGCSSSQGDGNESADALSESSDSSAAAQDDTSGTEPTTETDESSDDSQSSSAGGNGVGESNEPNGEGLDGDELASNIGAEYRDRWQEFFGMPIESDEVPVRCDGLEAQLGATTDCEVELGEGMWMPLDVEVTAVTPLGIEYQVAPSLGG